MIFSHKLPKVKASLIPILIALGIVYGDIGTSPLYVMRAIMFNKVISIELIYGAVSCVFWTLTLQTSLKYILIVLSADRQGQGGMLALYSLIKRGKKWWIIIFAMIGASLLLSEGIITPAISVSSAIEGLKIFDPDLNTMPIVMTILAVLFAIQRFGTTIVGTLFGPIMFCWFLMIGIFGVINIITHPEILNAINPFYAINLLIKYPGGILILGAVFLCTTGAEALYSDMGHCDRKSIRRGWIFVKICLIMNYFGQGAWLTEMRGSVLEKGINPFFAIIPEHLLLAAIGVATMATIIASQALITGSFSLINEASRLNIFPKIKIKYPTRKQAQIYIPFVNNFLFIGCIGIVYYFKESHYMEAAYGLSVVSGMICTTILFFCYLITNNKLPKIICYLFLVVFLIIESHFFAASIYKFFEGGWIVMLIASVIFCTMWFWTQAKMFRRRNIKFIDVDDVISDLIDLSNDRNINKVANHIAYLTSSQNPDRIENKITYSLFENRPKRANIYWFIHVNIVNQPYVCNYKTTIYSAKDVVRIDFNIGFKIQPRIGLFFNEVVSELINNNEIELESNDEYEKKVNINGDVKFIIWKKFISNHHYLDLYHRFITSCYDVIGKISVKEDEFYGLDDRPHEVEIEMVPINLESNYKSNLKRIYQ